MNYRIAKILAEDTWEGAGTKTIDLNIKDVISRIIIGVRENTGGEKMAAQMAANITKVELIDGSDVLHSLNGLENQAVCIYDRRVNTMNHPAVIGASSMYATLGIDFGRRLWDPELAFDPTKFSNPQLKVSYDVDVVRSVATSLLVEIWAQCFDEKVVTPLGFLATKELWNANSPADGSYKYIDLPTDHIMRKLFIRGYYAKDEPWYCCQGARLDEDNDKRVVFDFDLEDYHRFKKGEWLPVIEGFVGYAGIGNAYEKFVTPTDYYMSMAFTPNDALMPFNAYPAKGGFLDIHCSGTALLMGLVYGWLPNHVFELPFGVPEDMADWYDVTKVGSLRLRVEGGGRGTDGTIQLITQQLRKY